MKLKVFLTLCVCLSLCACKPKTKEYYVLHPEQLITKQEACKDLENVSQDPSCRVANDAALKVQEIFNELRDNRELFGLHLLQAQMHLVELQLQIKALLAEGKSQEAEKFIAYEKQRQQQIAERLAIIRVTMHPS